MFERTPLITHISFPWLCYPAEDGSQVSLHKKISKKENVEESSRGVTLSIKVVSFTFLRDTIENFDQTLIICWYPNSGLDL